MRSVIGYKRNYIQISIYFERIWIEDIIIILCIDRKPNKSDDAVLPVYLPGNFIVPSLCTWKTRLCSRFSVIFFNPSETETEAVSTNTLTGITKPLSSVTILQAQQQREVFSFDADSIC